MRYADGRRPGTYTLPLLTQAVPLCCHRSVDALESHDVVFWLGDLNYRINGNSKAVRHLMRSRLHEVLHANDQLRLQQKMGTVFQVRVCGAGCCCVCVNTRGNTWRRVGSGGMAGSFNFSVCAPA
jgi:hypothetical protein